MRSRAATVLLNSGGPAVLECEDASSLGAPRAASALMAIMDASAPRLVARIAAPPEFLLGPDPDPARVDSRIQHRVKLASEVGSDCQKRTLRQRRPRTAAALSRSDKWPAGGTAGPVRRSAPYRRSPLMTAVIAPPPHHLGRPDPEAFRRKGLVAGAIELLSDLRPQLGERLPRARSQTQRAQRRPQLLRFKTLDGAGSKLGPGTPRGQRLGGIKAASLSVFLDRPAVLGKQMVPRDPLQPPPAEMALNEISLAVIRHDPTNAERNLATRRLGHVGAAAKGMTAAERTRNGCGERRAEESTHPARRHRADRCRDRPSSALSRSVSL